MPQKLSIGCTTFCVEAWKVEVKTTDTGKVYGNEKWQMKSVIKKENQICNPTLQLNQRNGDNIDYIPYVSQVLSH